MRFSYLNLLTLIFLCPFSSYAETSSSMMAAAALVSSATPAIVAGIDSSAQKSIASTNATKDMAINSQNNAASVAMAGMEAQSSMYNSMTQAKISEINQQGETDRLALQLSAKTQTELLQMKLQAMQFAAEFSLKLQQLSLQALQMKADQALAAAKTKLELMKAGLSDGSTPQDSGKFVATAGSNAARPVRSINAYGAPANSGGSLTQSIQSMNPPSNPAGDPIALPFQRNPL